MGRTIIEYRFDILSPHRVRVNSFLDVITTGNPTWPAGAASRRLAVNVTVGLTGVGRQSSASRSVVGRKLISRRASSSSGASYKLAVFAAPGSILFSMPSNPAPRIAADAK